VETVFDGVPAVDFPVSELPVKKRYGKTVPEAEAERVRYHIDVPAEVRRHGDGKTASMMPHCRHVAGKTTSMTTSCRHAAGKTTSMVTEDGTFLTLWQTMPENARIFLILQRQCSKNARNI
jgi:hypothetical protein